MPPQTDLAEAAAATASNMDRTATTSRMDSPHMEVASGSADYDETVNKDNKSGTSAIKDNKKDRSFYLRWSRLQKTVQVKELTGGIMKGSISTSKSKNKKPSNACSPSEFFTSSAGTASKSSTKVILNSVSAGAAPGQVLAIMGPSGSGKTSLMNVLSGRSAYDSGVISINGEPVGDSTMKRLMSKVAYVKQADVFFGHLTVRDQFTYTALLRMPSNVPTPDKHAEVERIVRQLRLSHVADSPINMISGGEKKRVNIGTELLTDPIVLLLDEPTSGLDSTTAVSLINMLQDLARTDNKTVITSIHQPSSAVFRSFDQLLMLSQGQVVYFGSPFESLQYLRLKESELRNANPNADVPGLECPDGYNAADHWMDLLVADTAVEDERREEQLLLLKDDGDEEKPEEFRRRRGAQVKDMASPRFLLQDAWDNDATAESMDQTLSSSIHNTGNHHQDAADSTSIHDLGKKYNTSWSTQYYILTHRALKNSRSAIFTVLNLIKSVAIGAVAGLLWFQMDYTEANVNDIRSYFFFGCTFWVFDSMFTALYAFPSEREVVLKERASGSYHLSAYFMAKTSADAPVRLILPFLYVCVSYWMTGIDDRFSVFAGTIGCTLLCCLSGEALGLFIGAAMYDFQKAMTVLTVSALSLMLLGGFFVENVPSFIIWCKYLSPFKYSFDASLQIVFDRDVPCDGSGSLESLCGGQDTGVADAAAVREFIGVQGSIGFNIGMLLVISLVPRYFAYLALRMKKSGERE